MATKEHETLSDGNSTTRYTLTSGVKLMDCKYECGDVFVVSIRTKNAPHHLECGIKAAVACAKQLHEHQGPYYSAWLNGMAAWFGRMRIKY